MHIHGHYDMGDVKLLETIADMAKIQKAHSNRSYTTSFILRATTDSRSSFIALLVNGPTQQKQSCMCHTSPPLYAASPRGIAAQPSEVPYLEHSPILISATTIARLIRITLREHP